MKCYKPFILHMRSTRHGFTLIELLVVVTIIIVLVGIVLAVGTVLGASAATNQTKTTIQILESALTEWEAQSNRQLTWGTDDFPFQGSYYDMQSETSHIFLISEMLATVGRLTLDGNGNVVSPNSQVGSILAQIDTDKMHIYRSSGGFGNTIPPWLSENNNYDFSDTEPDPNAGNWVSDYQTGMWNGRAAVLDAWDRPIRFIHPGRLWDDGDPFYDAVDIRDADDTIKTGYEVLYGDCVNRKAYFVSAGPDGKFGDLLADPGSGDDVEIARYQALLDNIYSYEVIKP